MRLVCITDTLVVGVPKGEGSCTEWARLGLGLGAVVGSECERTCPRARPAAGGVYRGGEGSAVGRWWRWWWW